MEADWDEIQRIPVPPPASPGLSLGVSTSSPASTLAFDASQELLWVGNEHGLLTSFYGLELRRYTSVAAHSSSDGPVRQLLFHERGVLSVAPTSINCCLRRGLNVWHLTDPSAKDLQCMSYMGKDNRFAVAAGCQPYMLKFDVRTGELLERVSTRDNGVVEYMMMRRSANYICAATSTGAVDVLDADTLRLIKTLATNNVGICDMDAQNHYLVTCGWTNRAGGTPMLGTLANVYDLRAMVQLPPVSFHAGAAHVAMHPKLSTTCVIASQAGQLQVVDLMNQNAINLRQVNVQAYVTGLAMAPSGEAMAIADANGTVSLLGSPRVQFAEFSNPTEFADPPAPLPEMGVDSDLPLHTVGMPFYRDPLLSIWPTDQVYDVGSPPVKIDPAITNALRANTIGMWAPNPFEKIKPRNLAEKPRSLEQDGAPLAAPKFLSEKAKGGDTSQHVVRRISDTQDLVDNLTIKGVTKSDVPGIYRNVEIKYSKFGVDDFDFKYYNKTHHSGLETHIANSYINSLLQVLKFTPLTRNLALQHTAANCLSEICLLCELGFLFDTLEKADGQNCQATNFLKAFSSMPEAARLNLLEEYSHIATFAEMMQSACRFLLNQTLSDYRRIAGNTKKFEQTFTIDAIQTMRCNHCHNEMVKPGSTLSTDLSYQTTPAGRARNQVPTFSQVLKSSIEYQIQSRGWCDKCRRYQNLHLRRTLRNIPDVLMINTIAKSTDAKRHWGTPGWLPDKIGVSLDSGKFVCFEGEDLRLHLEKKMYNLRVYDLVGLVADIHSGEHQKSHLISLIDVSVSDPSPADGSDWHLFNDFLVRRRKKEDALNFNPTWKMPVILAFQAETGRHAVDTSWKQKLDTTLLFTDWSMNKRPAEDCRVLDRKSEPPKAGDPIAIDTEFVALQQEEIEIKADGGREVIRPTRLGLARVSVLRGFGEDEGHPFINDYITITEPIVDYLTKWSGVTEGDLDPRTSTHPLVPLKVAYKKLWLLVNLGCVFVGHGLPKDFRTINIHVPKTQVLDTVELFLSRTTQRKLSLRYLAWYLLKEDIQQDNHDSIEDARTALRLWRKYEEFKDAGIVEQMLEEIYREGKKWQYKPPGEAQTLIKQRAEIESEGGLTVQGELGGRDTPDILQGASGAGTPLGRRVGRSSEYFDSPGR